tara:strand:- start:872 stop:1126 length:255 start_codon:yes stop_codon:yes gene_type:complete
MLISSCSGMNSKRSQNSDEFLIQKKNPLVMPPDIDDLPKPKEEGVVEEKNDFKDALGSKKVEDQSFNSSTNSSLKESILKKIED